MRKIDKTNYEFKLLYFFGLIFVVAGHCGGGGISPFTDWFPFYSFHLALFIFASGYFFKESSADKPHLYILKKIKHLLIPLFLYNLFYGLFDLVLHKFGFTIGGEFNLHNIFVEPLLGGHQFAFNLGGWFVIPLFMIEVFTCLLSFSFKKIRNIYMDIAFLILYVLLGILGVELAIRGYNTGWYLCLTRFLYFMPFYAIGIFYKKHLERLDKKVNSIIYISAILIIQLIMVCYFKGLPNINQAWMVGFETIGSGASLIYGITGIAFWLRISKILAPILGKNKLINKISDNAYSITINQLLGFFILNSIYLGFSKFIPTFIDFSYQSYISNVYYVYFISNQWISSILYVVFGIAFSVGVGELIKLIKSKSRKQFLVYAKKHNLKLGKNI